jgi:antitoxin CptB
MNDEPRAHRLKRLHMRSMRRGIKEMDLILTAYAERHLGELDAASLDTYDALLNENDQDLYRWVTGQESAPDRFSDMISMISLTFQK